MYLYLGVEVEMAWMERALGEKDTQVIVLPDGVAFVVGVEERN